MVLKRKTIDCQGVIKKDKYGNPELHVQGWESTWKRVVDNFLGQNSEVKVTISFQKTHEKRITSPQRGYIMAELAPLCKLMLENWGWYVQTDKDALDLIKRHPDVGFVDETGAALSLSDGSGVPREKIMEFIDRLFLLLSENGQNPSPPSQFRKYKRWKVK